MGYKHWRNTMYLIGMWFASACLLNTNSSRICIPQTGTAMGKKLYSPALIHILFANGEGGDSY